MANIRYLDKCNPSVLTIFSAIKRAIFHFSSTIIGKVCSFGCVIYSFTEEHWWRCAYIIYHNNVNFIYIVVGDMEFNLTSVVVVVERKVNIPVLVLCRHLKYYATQGTFLFGTISMDRVQCQCVPY